MDQKLKNAIDKGRAAKEKKDREDRKAADAVRTAHEKAIKAQLGNARRWIDEVLMAKIAEAEASGTHYRNYYLGSGNVDGISAEAIYEAAKKVKGLHPTYNCPPIYENAEFQGTGEPVYSISWDSTDPNDNRDDR
jgi:hypothetical protein